MYLPKHFEKPSIAVMHELMCGKYCYRLCFVGSTTFIQ